MKIDVSKYVPGTATRPCPECGQVLADHDDAKLDDCWVRMQAKKTIDESIKRLSVTGSVSPRFGDFQFELSNNKIMAKNNQAWDNCKSWIDSDFTGLYLWGKPGTGKTHAARCIVYEGIKRGFSIVDVTAYNLIKKANNDWNNVEFLKKAETAQLLLIDDIDKVDWRPKELSYLWSLLNARAEDMRRTIITTNVSPLKFRDVFSEAGAGNDSKIEATLQRLQPCDTMEFKGGSVRNMKKGCDNG